MGSKSSSAAHAGAKERKILDFDPEDLVIVEDPNADLADDRGQESIPESFIRNLKVFGVRESITVKKNPETGKTEVVNGRKRTLGLREANKRIKKEGGEPWRIPAVPHRGTSGDSIGLMLMLNHQRFDESPMNTAKKIARMLDRGKTEEDVALCIGKSVATVKNLVALLDAPAVVRHAVESEKITVSDGYKLAKLDVDDAKKKVAQLIEHAPRTPGKKRSKNAGKARAIVGGGKDKKPAASSGGGNHDGMRAVNQVENLKRELEEAKEGPGRDAAIKVAAWVLGDDSLGGFKGLIAAVVG